LTLISETQKGHTGDAAGGPVLLCPCLTLTLTLNEIWQLGSSGLGDWTLKIAELYQFLCQLL
jgi:hypothetical protein